MTKYLAIALLITGFLVGDAYGEYCDIEVLKTYPKGFDFIDDLGSKSQEAQARADKHKNKVIACRVEAYSTQTPIDDEKKEEFENWHKYLSEDGDNIDSLERGKIQFYVGTYLLEGYGTKRNPIKAIKLLVKSAIGEGYFLSLYFLQKIFLHGLGFHKDIKIYKLLVELGAEWGHSGSQSRLAGHYAFGEYGFIKDLVQTHKWKNIQSTQDLYAKVGLKLYEKEMTRRQIADAEKLAREWIEKKEKYEYEKKDDPRETYLLEQFLKQGENFIPKLN